MELGHGDCGAGLFDYVLLLLHSLLSSPLFRIKIISSKYPISLDLLIQLQPYVVVVLHLNSVDPIRNSVSTLALDYRPLRKKEKLFALNESLFSTGSCHGDGRIIFDVVLKKDSAKITYSRGMTY